MLKNIQEWILLFVIIGAMIIIGNWIGYDIMPLQAIPGIITLALISLAGLIIHRLIPSKKIPSIAYIGLLAFILTIPGFPGSEQIVTWTSEVNLLAITTPILAYAGISIGRSWADFVKLGWKTIIVGMFVLVGTYLGSAIIAEITLRIQGVI
ncbi:MULTISPECIES: hypothetical protein [Virgibacillus]|uniref:DUF340 domain-containing protein n=2 Tax=Virgibacillus TaxID=84406 RepID=A0A024Q913_9BACI|nr:MULTISPECIES: hypothetical protein [Virgibacillus]EQB37755.1 membrane protein [Virgibacillus sp. CM-4]MYL40490.1 hypothetical protein [Virgibacillus massiliensis]GGJ58539.1 hypothetical protein GCM10007111_20720 [Virgibacillus kapii]CDQ38720.1 hypothetical protein BN990_00993 [Virgibacillus massiliensis]